MRLAIVLALFFKACAMLVQEACTRDGPHEVAGVDEQVLKGYDEVLKHYERHHADRFGHAAVRDREGDDLDLWNEEQEEKEHRACQAQ